MGDCYAPSVANLVLNKWEQENIYGQEWQGLTFYKRYIDDIVLLWEGSQASLEPFKGAMNANRHCLEF